ncbi:SidA/IucD/PvdA family monooxygenase [Nocardia sp. BMG111209]|uniref:SidA/IucD/PvdA family monooxygenase n=1 Tax=Nocardia sp. BMG111209 TaxID=1160137 RepID=UPI000374F212|nr:SidA/IucD/PvdA family monooxygenase [Nocardia sp. BMG111209]
MRTLTVIGAGPKAVAVAAKAHVLRSLGYAAPTVRALDHRGVGGHWLPGGGWTDGRRRLDTSPEKDIGFPYRSAPADGVSAEINTRMQRFSWHSYLIEHGGYAEWVDRGRPTPRHDTWAHYLRWVARRVDLELVEAEVVSVSVSTDHRRWQLTARTTTTEEELDADTVMITGPGPATAVLVPNQPRVLSVSTFWQLAATRSLPAADRIAVLGGGETAAAVVDVLATRHDGAGIVVVSPNATLYTRGESYFESTLYSDPSGWAELPPDERLELIRHTDRSVFSARVQQSLLPDDRIRHLPGRVRHADAGPDSVLLSVQEVGGRSTAHLFDLVVDAAGGDPLWFLALFSAEARDLLESSAGAPIDEPGLRATIGPDLAVTGLTPMLFLPNLAGFSQGPGFPNLGCLGLLSDRVIDAVRAAPALLPDQAGLP